MCARLTNKRCAPTHKMFYYRVQTITTTMAGICNYMASLMIVVQEHFWRKNLGLIRILSTNAVRSSVFPVCSALPRTDHLTENRKRMGEVSLAVTAFSCTPLFTLSQYCWTVLWYPRLRRYLIFKETSEFLHRLHIMSMLRIRVCAHAWTTVSCRSPSLPTMSVWTIWTSGGQTCNKQLFLRELFWTCLRRQWEWHH